MKIYLATDHAGFEMKENIKLFLEIEKENLQKEMENNLSLIISEIEIIDCGAFKYEEGDDYTKYISKAAGFLSADIYIGEKNNFAIIFGGSGEGEAMLADKYKGLRAGVINTENLELVKLLREHNNANVISFGVRFLSEDFIKKAIYKFLNTKFVETENGKETRHQRRIKAIENIEEEINIKVNTKVNDEELLELKELENMRQDLQK